MRRYFKIGHVAITLIGKHIELLTRTGDWMKQFEVDKSIVKSAEKHVQFSMVAYESNERLYFRLPASAVLLYKNDYSKYYDLNGLWIIELQVATVIIDRTKNKIIALTYYKDLQKSAFLEDFMHPLVELLRQNGLYAHHAASVSYEGTGLLMLGKSGQGKTTLSVDLLEHGFDFLSDDRCFLRYDHNGNMQMIGFYEPIRYFTGNLRHIQSIANAKTNLPVLGNGKYQLDLHPFYAQKMIKQSQVCGLVFPCYSPHEESSRLEKMSPGEALIAVLPLTMVCFDKTTSKSHFDFCIGMTSRLPAVRIIMGKDKHNWHRLIRSFLATIQQPQTTNENG